MPMLKAEHLSKTYQMGEVFVHALQDVSFEIGAGEFVVILGPSGSGKSTLLNIIGGMDRPTSGTFSVMGVNMTDGDDRQLTIYRRDQVGFVFQFYNIMPNLTAEENVELATELSPHPLSIADIMEAVGLAERRDHFPAQLSGGEQQRIAIARAVAKNPALLLCDEPTGALDLATGISILSLLRKINAEMGKTIIVITHNTDIAHMADRVIKMKSGRIVKDEINQQPLPVEEIKW